MRFALSLLITIPALSLCRGVEFDYRYQSKWYDMENTECNLKSQSPIELSSSEASALNDISEIVFKNYNIRYSAILSNNGHSANIQLPKRRHSSWISGGPLQNTNYTPESIHFHWGSQDSHGSEHVIDSQRYSMEMHIVHRNSNYDTLDEATKHDDGVAVFGILFQAGLSESGFDGLNNIVNSLQYIEEFNQSIAIDNINLFDLLGDIPTTTFYTYQGSLTTPPCSEAVTWIVFPHVINISSHQMSAFRLLTDNYGDELVNNYRHLQAKGSRPVYLSQ